MGEANQPSQGVTLAVIGAGKMGTAVLSGILANRSTTTTTPSSVPVPITKFIATVNTYSSVQRLAIALAPYHNNEAEDSPTLSIYYSTANVSALEAADVVLLACKPYLAAQILTTPGVRAALSGKFLISVLAGSSPATLENLIYGGSRQEWGFADPEEPPVVRCRIMRATPNMAASVRASETLLERLAAGEEALPPRFTALAEWIFGSVGGVRYVEPGVFDAASVVTGAGMAFLTVAVDGMLDGAVVEGIKRAEAREMVARTLRGLAALLASEDEEGGDEMEGGGIGGERKGGRRREGMHPAVLREEISSPRGTTIRGLLALEEGRVRMSFAKAVMDAAARAREL